VDARTDVYATGVVLYEALVGRPPFAAGDSPLAVLTQALESAPPDPAAVNPRVPRALADVVLRALAKDPRDRPQSAAELADQLTRAA
jgi:serine/threonine-protein kinase